MAFGMSWHIQSAFPRRAGGRAHFSVNHGVTSLLLTTGSGIQEDLLSASSCCLRAGTEAKEA